jgi:hypothetical protein
LNTLKENTKVSIEQDIKMQKLKEELSKSFEAYRTTMQFLSADAPIEVLCLPKTIEKILLDAGCLRVYDLFDMDFTEIKGLGPVRIRDLTSRFQKFISMF